ncbi:MAG: AAA family ATPase [Deltaproteobacteria bacterium]|nr:AAA family ATPase [Deltaproteobacteria bacterium]
MATRKLTGHIRDLMAERLDLTVDPSSLFEVALGDEAAIRVEAERLRTILAHAARIPADAGISDATVAGPSRRARPRRGHDRRRDAGAPPDATPHELPRDLPASLWAARVELDRARLDFLVLPRARREELLGRHAARQRGAGANKEAAEISAANRRALAATEERQLALSMARRARSEAERLVAEERARLLDVAREQAELEGRIARESQALKERADKTLLLLREVRELEQTRKNGAGADALYANLRAWVRATREEVAAALAAPRREVPGASDDRLAGLAVDVDRQSVGQTRATLEKAARRLRVLAERARWARVHGLHAEMLALNDARLRLLPQLSASKRSAITGFSEVGREQAGAELRQVTLVLRYHLQATLRWLAAIRGGQGSERSKSLVTVSLIAVKWLFCFIALFWWRRRAEAVLEGARERLHERDRHARRAGESWRTRGIRYLLHVRRPLEWLLLGLTLLWFLPPEAKDLFEVEILFVVVGWILGGSLAVLSIDALAGQVEARGAPRSATSALRLRSLRLTGRTVVVVGLILAISQRIVGKGTIYSWVFSTCWFAVLPVFLVIIRWWRQVIFQRMARFRTRRAFFRWVDAHQAGWSSLPAAAMGGAYLFVHGASRAARAWVGRFDATRRLLAYLFRRGLKKKAAEGALVSLKPLPEELFQKLSPEAPPRKILVDQDDSVEKVLRRIKADGGGVYVVIGERGSGKSTVLRRARDALTAVSLVDCPIAGLDALRAELARALRLEDGATLDEAGQVANRAGSTVADSALVIDNAHRLIHPQMGGLQAFDALLEVARRNSSSCAWVLALDATIWRFFLRARGERPTFDDVMTLPIWREPDVVALLQTRSREAGIEPRFDHLLEQLPGDADEIEREEALARTEASYYRMIWDYSAGNPGVALHMWRRSLGVDDEGTVFVKLFKAPDTVDLERLPDDVVFVLRSVLRLELALPADLVRATMLPDAQVASALRYGLARGYFEDLEGRYRVTWGWYRAVTRLLQRRHLLPASR